MNEVPEGEGEARADDSGETDDQREKREAIAEEHRARSSDSPRRRSM